MKFGKIFNVGVLTVSVVSLAGVSSAQAPVFGTVSLPDLATSGVPELVLPPLPVSTSAGSVVTSSSSYVAAPVETTVSVSVSVDPELMKLEDNLTQYLSETGDVHGTSLQEYEQMMRNKYASEMTVNVKTVILGTLKSDPNITQSAYNVRSAVQKVIGSYGIYDMQLTADANYADTETPSLARRNAVAGDDKTIVNRILSDQTQLNAGMSQLLSTGGTVNYGMSWEKSTSNNPTAVTPSWYSAQGLSFSQPLMRGFGKEITEYGIRTAILDRSLNNQSMRAIVIQEVGSAMMAYYDLVSANATVLVNRIALAQAQELYRINKAKNDAQLLPQLDVLQAQAEVALREQNIVSALQTAGNASDTLIAYFGNLLNMQHVALIPQDMPALPVYDLNEEQFMSDARRCNPGYLQTLINISKANETKRYAYDQTRASLTANMGVSNAGTGIDGTAPIDGILDNKYTNWNAGLAWSMSLQNRTAIANYNISDIGVQQAGTSRDQSERQLLANLRNGIRQAQTSYANSQFGKSTVEYNIKKVDDGKNRQSVGLSTSYEVLQFEQDLANSRISLIQALCSYNKSIIQLEMLKGTLLMSLNVTPVGDMILVDPAKVPANPLAKKQ